MKNKDNCRVGAAVFCLLFMLFALATPAQTLPDPGAVAYAGPRFPGGPDSLRAYLARHPLHQTNELVWVQFDIGPESAHPQNIHPLTAPGHKPWPSAVVAEVTRLLLDMPAWTPGRQDVPTPITTMTLGLNARIRPAAIAYTYADEMPVFEGIGPGVIGLYENMADILVMTPEILLKKLNGDVYAYFEVSETGRVEHPRVLEGPLPALNEAALQTLRKLPATAQKPAQLNGRSVRIYYVLSLGYRVK